MKYNYKQFLSLLLIGLIGLFSQAQDTLKFNRTSTIGQSNSLEAYAGSVIELGPGVLLTVDGSLCLEGEKGKPVKIINADPQNPALGIQIQGQTADADVKIRYVQFEGMIQALRFDPFWQRDEVILSDLSIYGSKSGEPVIYLGDPYIDRRKGATIDLKIKDVEFINNRAGLVIEAYGTPNVNYEIENLLFRDNYFDGPEQAIVHVELFPESNNVEGMGSFVFDRNRFEYEPLYLSLSSNFDQELPIRSVATEAPYVPVLDQTKDPRLGRFQIKSIRNLKKSEKTDYHVLAHRPGEVVLHVENIGRKNLNFKLNDRKEAELNFDFLPMGDSIVMLYSGGPAKFLHLANGYRVVLPKVDSSDFLLIDEAIYVEEPVVEELDTNKAPLLESVEKVASGTYDLFTRNTQPVKRWELGLWGGGALYGAGDIKPKFELIDDLVYLPSTIDYSFGLYAQYNFNSRFSAKATFYQSGISMHDLSAPGFFSGTAPLTAYNDDYDLVEMDQFSYQARFFTQMSILELEGLWHLRPYKVPDNHKSTLVPSLGISLGMFHYSPYRSKYVTRLEDDNYFSYRQRSNEQRLSLRDLGSEGQNFLPGAEPYSQFAMSGGLSFSLTWLFENFALKGEVRSVYTSTDYLDDFGPGLWYGGDREAVLDYHRVENPDADVSSTLGNLDLPRANTFRSTDGLNDWYFQGHLGLSIFLDKFKKQKVKL